MKNILFTAAAVLIFTSACSVQKGTREIASVDADNRAILTDFTTDSKPYELTDVAKAGLSSGRLWNEMQATSAELKLKNTASVCANRAHTWAFDMYQRHKVNSGKIIIFFGGGMYPEDAKQWWYHIAPYVIENGQEVVLDGGFSNIRGPISADAWIKHFGKGNPCKELTKKDVRYNSLTYKTTMLPGVGPDSEGIERGGEAKCYIRRIPMEYWTPLSVYMHEFNKDVRQQPLSVPFNGTDFSSVNGDKFNDVMIACNEASTGKIGGLLKGGMKRCRKHFGFVNERRLDD